MSNQFSAFDHAMMARTLRLAERGLITTMPNPRVGCVIARDAEVLAEGWHRRAGQPHAEADALQRLDGVATGATAYINLEPCAHHGRTPPCVNALVSARVARVVIATEDPFPQVAGAGIAQLREAGIDVQTGLMREAARELNRGFFSRIERGRPWLRLKLAQSVDGRTALTDGQSKWITGAAARADVQRWRARSCALMTGSGTARTDLPRLNLRDADRGIDRQPLRVVLDTRLDALVANCPLLDGSSPTLVFHAQGAQAANMAYAVAEKGAVGQVGGRLDLHEILNVLAAREINEVQVEAGAELSGALFAAGLVDEVLLYVAPMLLGDSGRPLLALPGLNSIDAASRLICVDRRAVGADMRLLLRPAHTPAAIRQT